jgi:hypothetical protein
VRNELVLCSLRGFVVIIVGFPFSLLTSCIAGWISDRFPTQRFPFMVVGLIIVGTFYTEVTALATIAGSS